MFRILPLLLILAGCAAHADDKRPTYTDALESFRSEVASVNATLGNQAAEIEGVKEELKAVKAGVTRIEKMLSVDTEISIAVPKAADPPAAAAPKVDAPPKDSDRRITFHGNPIDVSAWLSTKLTDKTRIGIGDRDSGNRAMVEQHLRYHGLEGDFSKYSRENLITLHSVAHLKDGIKPVKGAAAFASPKVAASATAIVPLPQSGGCPNGRCPNAQQSWAYYSRARRQ